MSEPRFTPGGRQMLIFVLVFEALFSVGVYAYLRWVEDMRDYALPAAAVSLLLGIGTAWIVAHTTSKAERAAGKAP